MQSEKKGDTVKVHYTLKNERGEVLESSKETMPLEFIIGEGNVVPGFEKGIIGMKSGESRTITVPEEDGYGSYEERKVFEFPKERAPSDFDPSLGQSVQLHAPDGTKFSVTVIGKTDKAFKMDANHPMAGKTLVFDVELVELLPY
ncbi:peptidylprolyl isomerase [bacterium]|nr:MAG: peptidylprolyl isomerase [bacterium]